MASNDNNPSNSPMHLGLTGQFSPEDIQELLGVMGDGSDAHHEGSDGENAGVSTGSDDGFTHLTDTNYSESSAPATASSSSASASNNRSSNDSHGLNTNNLTSDDANQTIAEPGDEAKAQARSERKRSREKQRRSDVNKQFADLTQLLQRIDAENINEEDVKTGTANRMTFNPSNRVDLIARTIVLLERLHEANKRRRMEISSLQQQLDEAKKAGEDTAAKLKEAMLAPPGQPANKQFMMMVPMMMSTDGTGSAVPMMNPFMPHAAMPHAAMPHAAMPHAAMPHAAMAHAYCPLPPQAMPTNVPPSSQPGAVPPPGAQAPSHAQAPAMPMAATNPPVAAPPVASAPHQQQPHPSQAAPHPIHPQAFPYVMAPHMVGGSFMMPIPAPGHAMPGQPMQPMTVQQGTSQESQNGQQEQKDSSNGLNGGSNLAHCA